MHVHPVILITLDHAVLLVMCIYEPGDNSNIVSQIKPLQVTLHFGLWTTANYVKHHFTLATRVPVSYCKAEFFVQRPHLVQKW